MVSNPKCRVHYVACEVRVVGTAKRVAGVRCGDSNESSRHRSTARRLRGLVAKYS